MDRKSGTADECAADAMILNHFLRRFALNEDILWNIFAESGRIADYLLYSAYKEDYHDNC